MVRLLSPPPPPAHSHPAKVKIFFDVCRIFSLIFFAFASARYKWAITAKIFLGTFTRNVCVRVFLFDLCRPILENQNSKYEHHDLLLQNPFLKV